MSKNVLRNVFIELLGAAVMTGCGVGSPVGEVVNNCTIPMGQHGHNEPRFGGLLGSTGGEASKNLTIHNRSPVYGGDFDTGFKERFFFARAEDGMFYVTGKGLNDCNVKVFDLEKRK